MAKILIVDDSTFMRKILIKICNEMGHKEIIEAADGAEAMQKFDSDKPDLILLDIIMEKKDRIEVLKEIMGKDKNAKIVMVSAVGQEQMVQEALKSGALDFIVKPFDNAAVKEKIKKVLGN